jgi:hypothetical protein
VRINKDELMDRLSKKRGLYRSNLVKTLLSDMESFGWIILDESKLKVRLDNLEESVRSDISTSPEVHIKWLKQEIWGKD